MIKPNNYDAMPQYYEHKKLVPGGYVCCIRSAEEMTSKAGNGMVIFNLDILEGEYKNYFYNMYSNNTNPARRWGCRYLQMVSDADGNCYQSFKTAEYYLKKCNKDFSVVWDDGFAECFKEKAIGVIFGEEEYELNRDIKIKVVPRFLTSIENIRSGNYEIPEIKRVQRAQATSAAYVPDAYIISAPPVDVPQRAPQAQMSVPPTAPSYFSDSEDLPF